MHPCKYVEMSFKWLPLESVARCKLRIIPHMLQATCLGLESRLVLCPQISIQFDVLMFDQTDATVTVIKELYILSLGVWQAVFS